MSPTPPSGMRKVYGRAFLIELEQGDEELARVFARAFLLAKNGPDEGVANGYG